MQLTDIAAHLADYDIVITSTGSSLPVLGKGTVEAAIKRRRHKPMFVVDIAVPRDVEPEVAELPDVYLYTIDDLTEIIEENIKQRRSAAEGAEHLVIEGAEAYTRERRAHEGQALLRSFRENAEAIQRAELSKALQDLSKGADPDVVIRSLSRSLTNKLIHQPTVAIRDASANDRSDLLEYLKSLYQLD